MKEKLVLYTVKNGCYLEMMPDLKKGKLVPSENYTQGFNFNLFGFMESIRANGFGYSAEVNMYLSREEVQLKTFKDLLDQLQKIINQYDAETTSMLIRITEDQDSGTHWRLQADYQILMPRP